MPLWHLSGHLLSEVFVNGIMYAGTGVGCKPDAACHGVLPLCFGKVWQTGTADAIAYQSVNESGIEVVTGSDGAYRAHGWYRKTGTPFWGAQHDVFRTAGTEEQRAVGRDMAVVNFFRVA